MCLAQRLLILHNAQEEQEVEEAGEGEGGGRREEGGGRGGEGGGGRGEGGGGGGERRRAKAGLKLVFHSVPRLV